MPVLHVAIPFFNEPATLEACLQRVAAAPLPEGWTSSLVLVDDHSNAEGEDATRLVLEGLRRGAVDVHLERHSENRGKGAALTTAFDHILDRANDDDLVIIQDADLEYDPRDFAALMDPIVEGDVDATIGNRFHDHSGARGMIRRVHTFGNRALSTLSNLLTGLRLTDMECCYKVMTVPVLRQVRPMLTEPRFGIEPQMVASLARLGVRVREIPVSYDPRGFEAGKKIGWRDGVRAIIVIMRERLRGRAGGSDA